MKIIDVSRPPKEIWLGRDGENNWRPIAFECVSWLAKRPDGIITVWMEANGSKFPLSAVMDGTKAVWYPQQEELFLGGSRIEVSIQSGDDVGTSAIIDCRVDESLIGDGEHPAQEMPPWGVEVVAKTKENADRAEAAAEHYPKIVNGVWHVWDAVQSKFVSTGISAQGEDGVSPTVTVEAIEGGHRVTITDADGAHTFDVMDGEGGSGESATVVVTIYDTTDPPTASMTAGEIKAAVDRGERVVARYIEVDVPYVAYAGQTAVFAAIVDFGHTPTTVAIMVTANGVAILVTTPLAAYDDIPTPQEMSNAAPVQSVNGMTGAVTIPIPTAVTEQTVSGWGFTKNTGTYVKPVGGIPDSDIASAATWNAKGTYSKPSGGIPKTDLASDVQTSLGKADTALQQHQSLTGYATETWVEGKGYQTASDVQTAIAGIPDELPAVTASDNGKFLRVVSGAWAAETVPAAESNLFGGGS